VYEHHTKMRGMSRTKLIASVCILIAVLFALYFFLFKPQSPESAAVEVREHVEEFGGKLQMVSILAPYDVVSTIMDEHYGPYVSAELLAQWKMSPLSAPGRATSSPYPGRIDVRVVTPNADGSFTVEGRVIEVTADNSEIAKRSMRAVVEKSNNSWVITMFDLGPYVR
jgi:hypothetical protein